MFRNTAKVISLIALLLGNLALAVPCAVAGVSTATVSGTITEAGSGDPIEGATVAVAKITGGLAVGTTDSSGDYTVDVSMSPDDVDIVVEAAAPNHAPSRYDFSGEPDCYFGCGPLDGAFTIGPGEAVTGIDIVLDAGGTISGTVTDSQSGNPLENARIDLRSEEAYNFSTHFDAYTDSSGEYIQPLALGPGSYFVTAVPDVSDNYVAQAWQDYPCEHSNCPILDTDPIEIEAGVQETGFDFALEPGARISGSLQPDDIERIIRLYSGSGVPLDATGFLSHNLPAAEWSFDGLSGGSYYIEIGPLIGPAFEGGSPYIRKLHNGLICPYGGCDRARGVPITIPPGSELSIPEIELQLGGQIKGTIVDADTGETPSVPADSQLNLYDIIDSDGKVVGGGTVREQDGDLILDESSGIPPGEYYVRTYHAFDGSGIGYDHPGYNHGTLPGYADAMYPDVPCAGLDCDTDTAETVTVSADSITNISIELTSGSNISGTVVDDVDDTPVDNAYVKLVNADNEVHATAITDDDGHFSFGAFPAGSYYLRTSMSTQLILRNHLSQNPYFDKVYGASENCSEQLCDPTDGDEIVLDGTSDTGPLELRVESGPVIHGRIIFSLTGLLIQRGHVEVYDDSDRFVGRYAVHAQTGRYQTTALPPGDYRLVPVVSPAYSDVTTPPGSIGSGAARSAARDAEGLVVTVGAEDVEADLQMIDEGIDRLFSDSFKSP